VTTVEFPPADGVIIEHGDRRIVQIRKTVEGFSIDVWLRHVVSVRPTKLGGWYCSPDAGVNLTDAGGRLLYAALEALR
jgi:hypothetical protein